MTLTASNVWYESKALLRDLLGVSTNEAHVHIGLALFVIGALLLGRRKHRFVLAWLIVAVAETANEVLDARDWVMWTGTVNWPEMAKGYFLTLFWPSVLCLFMTKLSRDLNRKSK